MKGSEGFGGAESVGVLRLRASRFAQEGGGLFGLKVDLCGRIFVVFMRLG